MSGILKVRFTHPRKSTSFPADVDTQLTAKEAIRELSSAGSGPFLPSLQPGQEYVLVLNRTSTLLTPNMTMDAAGVIENDTLAVVLKSDAACLAARTI